MSEERGVRGGLPPGGAGGSGGGGQGTAGAGQGQDGADPPSVAAGSNRGAPIGRNPSRSNIHSVSGSAPPPPADKPPRV